MISKAEIGALKDYLETNDESELKIARGFLEDVISSLEEIQQYRSIGAVSECREAMEKQKEKKPIARNDDRKIYMCQCGNTQINTMDNYCGVCGQAIDWSDTP